MIGRDKHGHQSWRRRTPLGETLVWMSWLIGLAVVIACFQRIAADTTWSFVADAPAQAADIAARMFPPAWTGAAQLLRPLWDTLTMATLGTALAIIVALPLAFLAARNTTPSAALLRPAALLLIVASRSINALIWGLVLVVIVGPGVLAGVLAIALRSVGFIAKLLYEALEESDPKSAEAVAATGAAPAQVIAYGLWPQVRPAFAGISLFRWDINIREATVLGLVGAGGIGLQLNAAINTLEWSRVALILVLIFVAVIAAEALSAKVRAAVT